MKKMDALTSLRFFAAFAIVIHHSADSFKSTSWMAGALPYDFGVSFFFVLSGFILAYVYRDFRSKQDLMNFYTARVARIWPLHIATLILFFLLVPKQSWFFGPSGHEASIVAANLFLVQAWIPRASYFFSFNAVSWSISAEVFFYLAFPLLRYKWSHTWHWKILLVMIVTGSLLTVTTMNQVPDFSFEHPMEVSNLGYGYISPLTRIIEFLLGMIGASSFQWLNQKRLRGGIALWTAIEIGALFLAPVLIRYVQSVPYRVIGQNLSGSWREYMGHNPAGLAFMIIIIVIALNRGALSKLLSVKPLVLLGEASFSLYLIHQLLMTWLNAHRAALTFVPDMALCVLYYGACLAAAFALWMFVEKPCREKIKSLLHASGAAPTPLTAPKTKTHQVY